MEPRFKPVQFTRNDLSSFSDEELWATLRSTNANSEYTCNVLCWVKAELKRRKLLPENAA